MAFRTQRPERVPGPSAPTSFLSGETEEGLSLPLSLSAPGPERQEEQGRGPRSLSTCSVPQPELTFYKQNFTLSSWPSLVFR